MRRPSDVRAEIRRGSVVLKNVQIQGVDVGVKVSLGLEIVGVALLILLLAEIFKYGVELQEEHDLTV